MQITKEQILSVLKEFVTIEQTGYMNGNAELIGLDDVAEQILTLLQPNDAGQPNGSKPDVSGSLPPDWRSILLKKYKLFITVNNELKGNDDEGWFYWDAEDFDFLTKVFQELRRQ
jgi:hypothetical protein